MFLWGRGNERGIGPIYCSDAYLLSYIWLTLVCVCVCIDQGCHWGDVLQIHEQTGKVGQQWKSAWVSGPHHHHHHVYVSYCQAIGHFRSTSCSGHVIGELIPTMARLLLSTINQPFSKGNWNTTEDYSRYSGDIDIGVCVCGGMNASKLC